MGRDAQDIVETSMRLREEDIDVDTKCHSQLGSGVLARLDTFYSPWVVCKFFSILASCMAIHDVYDFIVYRTVTLLNADRLWTYDLDCCLVFLRNQTRR